LRRDLGIGHIIGETPS
jgi:DNA polymerase I